MMRIIDLSTPIHTKAKAPTKVKIKRKGHAKGISMLELEAAIAEKGILKKTSNILKYLIGVRRVGKKGFPESKGLAWEVISTISHRGTHMDAPWHFGDICNGQRAKTIDEIPLDWCFHDGVLIDMSSKNRNDLISKEDITGYLERINYEIKPFDIVLIKTGCYKHWNSPDYLRNYPGLDVDALFYLIDKGIKIIGVDSYSLDRPSFIMVNEFFANNRDSSKLWPTHFAGRQKEYCHIEQLNNLDDLPIPFGFKISCFPVSIEKGSAGWCRVVAIINS